MPKRGQITSFRDDDTLFQVIAISLDLISENKRYTIMYGDVNFFRFLNLQAYSGTKFKTHEEFMKLRPMFLVNHGKLLWEKCVVNDKPGEMSKPVTATLDLYHQDEGLVQKEVKFTIVILSDENDDAEVYLQQV